MLFNSLDFIVFFAVVSCIYFLLPHKVRSFYLLTCSYFFYGYWNVKYLSLLIITTLSTYICGLGIAYYKKLSSKRVLILLACLVNFGLLGIFKYYEFVISSINHFLHMFGNSNVLPDSLNVLLTVGISFYTFQAMGYIIDVYRGTCMPEKNLITFALYVSFFPQLVAGPIERSYQLIPQLVKKTRINYDRIIQGFSLMLWGFFQKIVIADRLATYVDAVFGSPKQFDSLQLLWAVYFFSFQIYCDFAGYSNIAIGAASILDINLMKNFDRPYFATSIRDFWRRWHISLSTWFRDYLYIPLGGNRVSQNRLLFNLMVVFLICGLWHGAAWSFVIWGGIHGVLLCINNLAMKTEYKGPTNRNTIKKAINILITFHIVAFTWIFFRSENLNKALVFIGRLFSFDLPENIPLHKGIAGFNQYDFNLSFILICFLVLVEVLHSKNSFDVYWSNLKLYQRWSLSYVLIFAILIFGVFNLTEFIYFQF